MTCTNATYASACATCHGQIYIGDPIVPTKSRNQAVHESLLYIPEVVVNIIMRFAAAGGRIEDVFWIHRRCGAGTITSSGRKVLAPMRHSDRKFVGGSGFSGCDQYDGGFDGSGGDSFCYEKVTRATKADKNFVVDDDELTCQHALAEQFEEGEDWKSGDETDEEECSWDCESDDGDSKSSTKSVSFAEELEEVHEVEKLSMSEISGDWGATVRGDKTNDLHWEVLSGMRRAQERDIFEAWKKLVSY